jgi:hypothetical protein
MRSAVASFFIVIALTAASAAAPVTNWVVVNPSTGGSTTKPISGQATASPVLGDGTEDSAATVAMYAPISGTADANPDIQLANGQQVTLSGFATLTGITSAIEQFRWGLFQESSSPVDAINWSGYIASNSAGSGGGALRAKTAGDGTTFAQTGSAVTLQSSQDGDTFIDETYHFTMTVSRYNNEAIIDASLTSADDWTQVWNDAIPSSPTTFNFNRVGFLAGGGMHANRITFSNIDVTTLPIDTLSLQVHTAGPDAGKIVLQNNRPEAFEIEYYEITSTNSSLNHVDWNSLTAQEGDGEFEGWEEAAGIDGNLLSEYRLLSTMSVAPNSSLDLGKAFEVGAAQDLEFFVGIADGTFLRGVVEYVSDGLTGDFNRDNIVDAADYVAWRKGMGTTHIENDYALWKEAFQQSGSGTGFAVPEPATLLTLSFLTPFVLQAFSRHRGARLNIRPLPCSKHLLPIAIELPYKPLSQPSSRRAALLCQQQPATRRNNLEQVVRCRMIVVCGGRNPFPFDALPTFSVRSILQATFNRPDECVQIRVKRR